MWIFAKAGVAIIQTGTWLIIESAEKLGISLAYESIKSKLFSESNPDKTQ